MQNAVLQFSDDHHTLSMFKILQRSILRKNFLINLFEQVIDFCVFNYNIFTDLSKSFKDSKGLFSNSSSCYHKLLPKYHVSVSIASSLLNFCRYCIQLHFKHIYLFKYELSTTIQQNGPLSACSHFCLKEDTFCSLGWFWWV